MQLDGLPEKVHGGASLQLKRAGGLASEADPTHGPHTAGRYVGALAPSNHIRRLLSAVFRPR